MVEKSEKTFARKEIMSLSYPHAGWSKERIFCQRLIPHADGLVGCEKEGVRKSARISSTISRQAGQADSGRLFRAFIITVNLS